MCKRFLLAVLLVVASGAVSAEVHEHRLANGLKILVKEDHRAPVVVSQIWYKVGASYESSGSTGLSHVLEHMMFKGTEKYGPNEFSRIIAENGGRENAFTGADYTAYFQRLEKSRLEIAFELEADRMRNLKLDPDEFAKEVRVVMEERRMRTEDKPSALTYEQFKAAAFVANPYHNPVIGWMNDLENMTIEDLREWYALWYAPNNATLVVAGDVDPAEVFRLAEKHFGPLAPSPRSRIKPRTEPPQRSERRVTVRVPAKLPVIYMGWHVPVLRTAEATWQPYALRVLAGLLDEGDSSRLQKELVRGGLAAQASASYDLYSRQEDLFLLSGVPAGGRPTAELEQALRDQVTRLKEEVASEREMELVKAQIVAQDVFGLDSVFYQAMRIGMLETVGLPWQTMEAFVERIRAVTLEQVRTVARLYLNDDNLTVGILQPQEEEEKK